MLYLTLLRHAYSEKEIDCIDDFQRDISEKGKKEIEIIGKYLREKKICFHNDKHEKRVSFKPLPRKNSTML